MAEALDARSLQVRELWFMGTFLQVALPHTVNGTLKWLSLLLPLFNEINTR